MFNSWTNTDKLSIIFLFIDELLFSKVFGLFITQKLIFIPLSTPAKGFIVLESGTEKRDKLLCFLKRYA